MEQQPISSALGQENCQDLLSLPQAVLAQIAQLCSRTQGHPMLGLSRGGRDTVLSNLKSIRMSNYSAGIVPNIHSEPEPMARLLHRACCQAPVGLEVTINLTNSPSVDANYFPKLLQPGISCGGWHKVHKLQVRLNCRVTLHLFSMASSFDQLS
jgi:hypothetical protein